MNFIFKYLKKKEHKVNDASSSPSVDADLFDEDLRKSEKQYQEHRKNAEEHIKSGARLTRHRINL